MSTTEEDPGLTLQSEDAKATAAEIHADNAALEESYQAAEAQAEVMEARASQLAQATENVLEELQERRADA